MIILTDIDDTLMRTRRKVAQSISAGIQVGAVSTSGEPLSFIENARSQLVSLISSNKNTVIPVSARSISGLKRVKLSFKSYAVLNFGASVLSPSGAVDAEWDAQLRDNIKKYEIDSIFNTLINKLKDVQVVAEVKSELGLPLYLNVRSPDLNTELLEITKVKLLDYLAEQNLSFYFKAYQTDRDLALIPSYFSKEIASKYVLKKLGNPSEGTIGMGDNILDLEFMSLCDFVLTPTDSSLFAKIKGLL